MPGWRLVLGAAGQLGQQGVYYTSSTSPVARAFLGCIAAQALDLSTHRLAMCKLLNS
jgi:hypothetical protein